MLREEPSADTILLIYLGGTVGILICFASLMYWMTQPTVLASPELAFIERTPPAASNSNPLFRSAYENEGLAIAVAEQENDRQGLQGLAFGVAANPPPSLAKATGQLPMKDKKKRTVSTRGRSYSLQSRPVTPPANPFGFFRSWFR